MTIEELEQRLNRHEGQIMALADIVNHLIDQVKKNIDDSLSGNAMLAVQLEEIARVVGEMQERLGGTPRQRRDN